MLTLQQRVTHIDNYANELLSKGGDEALLLSMHDIMGDLKIIIDTATHEALDAFCTTNQGFHRCMFLLGNLASGVANGDIPLLPPEDIEQRRLSLCQKTHEAKGEWTADYKKIRDTLADLHPKFMVSFTREGVERCAKRLDISKNNALLLNTEHEMNVFFDYCLYQHHQDGLNAIQKSLGQYAGKNAEQLAVFEMASKGYFAYLQIITSLNDTAFLVWDLERQTKHIMLDNGLNQIAKNDSHHTIITHVIDCPHFLITTGASTPVNLSTPQGAKVHRRFEAFQKKLLSGNLALKDRKQYITDMYSLCLNEDITATISSPTLPFGEDALKARTPNSDAMH